MPLAGLTFLDSANKLPIMTLPVRSSVVELSTGKLLFSPGSSLTEAQLAAIGDVTDIVVPSLWHTTGGPNAAKVYPQARLWGPPGIREKFPKNTWSVFGEEPWHYNDELRVLPLAGMPKVREHIVFHVRSKSLLVADLFFNLTQAKGVGAWLLLHAAGSYRRFAVSRIFTSCIKDKSAFVESLRPLVKLDFTEVVPAHGEVLSTDAKATVLQALHRRNLGLD
jgi:glyoxylase-like metal-dependent hydrolase (beta-lactamase superfamily II)